MTDPDFHPPLDDFAPDPAGELVVSDPVVEEVAAPVVADPLVVEPIAPEPLVVEPVVAEPMVAEPVVADPVVADPVDDTFVPPTALPPESPPAPSALPPEVELAVPDTAPPVVEHPPPAPVEIYERGSMVSQVPIAEDVVTVDDVTGSEVYREWEQARGASGEAPGGLTLIEDPAAFDSPTMIGDQGDSSFWFQQNAQNSCGPSSATQIINDFLDAGHRDENVVAQRALDLDLYDPATGMKPQDLATLLTDQGVPSALEWEQDFEDVEQYLREGRAVVMFLDIKDISPFEDFAATDEVENSAQDTVDHFARVIGIDREAGIAVLADSGHPDAAQVQIPLADLEEAWNDFTHHDGMTRGRMLIVSDGADPTPDDAAPAGPVAGVPATQPQTGAPVTGTPDPQTTGEPETQPADTTGQPTGQPVVTTGQPVETTGQPVQTTGEPAATTGEPGQTTGEPAATTTGAPEPQSPGDPAPSSGTDPVPQTQEPAISPDGTISLSEPADSPSRIVAASTPAAPIRVQLPVIDGQLPVSEAAAAPADVELPVPETASSDDRNLFDPSVGWVIIPVAFAAGRVSAALRRR